MDAFSFDIAEIDELTTQVAIKGSLSDSEMAGGDLFSVVVAIVYAAA